MFWFGSIAAINLSEVAAVKVRPTIESVTVVLKCGTEVDVAFGDRFAESYVSICEALEHLFGGSK